MRALLLLPVRLVVLALSLAGFVAVFTMLGLVYLFRITFMHEEKHG